MASLKLPLRSTHCYPSRQQNRNKSKLFCVLERYSSSRVSNSGLNIAWLSEGELVLQQVGEQAVAPVPGKMQQQLGDGGSGGRKCSIKYGVNMPDGFS